MQKNFSKFIVPVLRKPWPNLLDNEVTVLSDHIQAWFDTKPLFFGDEFLEAAKDPQLVQLGSESLYPYLLDGSHELVSELLKNPGLPRGDWENWCWINPNAALSNPLWPMWLLEDPSFFRKIKIGYLMALMTSPLFPLSELSYQWFEVTGDAQLYESCVISPVMPTEWLLQVWEDAYQPSERRHRHAIAYYAMFNELKERGVIDGDWVTFSSDISKSVEERSIQVKRNVLVPGLTSYLTREGHTDISLSLKIIRENVDVVTERKSAQQTWASMTRSASQREEISSETTEKLIEQTIGKT